MTFIAIPWTVEVILTINLGGKPIINRHYATKTEATAPTATDCVNAANAVFDAYYDNWLPRLSTNTFIQDCTARSVNEQEGAFGVTTRTVPVAGPIASDELPNNVAAVVTLRTNYTGRSGRGRTYLGGLVEGNVDNNTLDSTVQVAALATLAAVDDELILVGMRHRMVSKWHNGVLRTPPLARTVASVVMNNRVDSQRRRLPSS